jgi:hypothetical protein
LSPPAAQPGFERLGSRINKANSAKKTVTALG